MPPGPCNRYQTLHRQSDNTWYTLLEATAADGSSEVRRRRSASPRLEAEVVYAAPASEAVAEAAAAPKASSQVQSARDEYRKNRFAGSSILKALALAGAKPQPLSEGGSYAG